MAKREQMGRQDLGHQESDNGVDATTSLVAHESELSRVADLGKNSFYNSKEELVLAVGFWNMKQGAEAKVVRSDQGRLYYKCKHSDKCKFDVRASCHGGGMWGVHKFKEHSCEGELGILKRIKAHSNVVAAYVEKRIRDDGEPDNLLVVSDAHVSIANAVKSELPNATHGLCYYHLQNKIKGYGQAVVELFRQAAYAYTDSEFSRAMSAMAQLKPAAYGKLMRVGPEKWARSQSPVTRYSFLTSNAAEALNARLLWARRLPICSMLEAIRMVLEQWFNDRLASAEESDDLLTPEAKQKISAEISKSRRYTAKRTSERKYKVRAGDRRFMVDLQAKSCECNEFDLDGMPCSHAIAAITEAKEPVEDYVEAYYLRSSLVQTYSGPVNHLPPLEHWEIPFEVATDIVLPNLSRRQAGRPRESRIPSAGERPTQRTTTADASSSLGKRAPKTCGLCGSPGHTRRACKGTGWEQ
ncbi:uncharacterized protein LOC130993985 [Salvia miltiorrhiza]|uniref:uncharacterized protein LOC130993985 n=1 Tax=Salvia miltiorrhiza TaxID=226208 RepID=UPI0025AC05C5|nr:uncharacterized protein LOC130993985 [Salvia miltiorrhiza]